MSKLEELIEQIQAKSEELATISGIKSKPLLHAPPRAENLKARLEKLEVTPPPSYLEFLHNHNGWENFWSGFSLLGVEGKHTELGLEDIEVSIEEDAWAQKRSFPNDAADGFAKREKNDPEFVHLPNHLIFATNSNGSLALFDRRTRDEAGEMQVRLWTPAGTTDKHPSFLSFLEFTLRDIEERLRGL